MTLSLVKPKHFFAYLYMALLFLQLPSTSFAKDLPPRPNPPRLVNDYAGVLSVEEREALENKLVAYSDSSSNQIAIVIENTLDGEEIADYAQRLGESWGIGRKEERNGVLIYLAVQDHNMTIQVGYGLEPVITDAATYRIREEQMAPNFRQNKYYEGLDQATTVLMKLASGEFNSDKYANKNQPGNSFSPRKIIIIIIIIIIIMSIFRRGGGGGKRRRGIMGPWGVGPFIGGGGFGGGGFGGGGGGGFGGFGGGSFGGGGSSGRW